MSEERKLGGVADTLYIPLVSRIYVSRRFPEFFFDEKALEMARNIPSDMIEKNSTEYDCMAGACRQYSMDKILSAFLREHPAANVVFLGAGLETAAHRLKNDTARFYQADLPEVIDIRGRVLGKKDNETLVPGDMFDFEWARYLDASLPTLVSVSGVFQYFEKEKVSGFIRAAAEKMPGGEMIFDATDSAGLKYANHYVQKTGNRSAEMRFAVDDAARFADETGTEIVGVYGFFTDALRLLKGLKLITRMFMHFADKWERTKVIHLKFPVR